MFLYFNAPESHNEIISRILENPTGSPENQLLRSGPGLPTPGLTGPVLCAAAVEELQLKDAHYTLEHLQAFGMFNHLQLDPWYQDSVLFVDSRGRVLSLSVTLDTALGKPKEVFSFGSESGRAEDRLCASISLTSATWAALSDGTGQLLLLRTGRRGDSGACRWEVLFSDHMGEPFTILHSVSHVQGGCHSVEVLLLRVQKEPLESTGSGYSVSLEWVTVGGAAGSGQERKYEVRKRRVLRGKSVPHYAAVAPRGEGLMLAAEKPFVFTHVNGRPVEPPPPPELSELDKTDPLYFWQQTAEDLTVCVRLPGGVAKEDVSFRLTADSLSIGVRGCPPIVEGQLYASVDPEASAWTISDSNSLEVSLQKLSEGPMWPELVLGNRTGELVLSNQQAALIHDRLTHLTSEDPVRSSAMLRMSSRRAVIDLGGRDDPQHQAVAMATLCQLTLSSLGLRPGREQEKPPCSSQELEDCDGFPDDGFSLTHFDGETLSPTQVIQKQDQNQNLKQDQDLDPVTSGQGRQLLWQRVCAALIHRAREKWCRIVL
ncbi:hypothetical protein CCH79_00020751 [Gambusia affinis]|uniref:NudC domain-containing protein 1 n=1 Tax=Gambusia affinis TaxID=33528 RepID=A0A315VI39_GAMAF|nr:hypothetical protein CCH79_00020751 [Gambusia affinis]